MGISSVVLCVYNTIPYTLVLRTVGYRTILLVRYTVYSTLYFVRTFKDLKKDEPHLCFASRLIPGSPVYRSTSCEAFYQPFKQIEAIEPLTRAGVPMDQISFIRIQSSHCETQDFHGILWNLDHNLLMHLALGTLTQSLPPLNLFICSVCVE